MAWGALCVTCLAGCGNYESRAPQYNPIFVPAVGIKMQSDGPAPATVAGADPVLPHSVSLANQPNPMQGQANPLAAGGDPLMHASNPMLSLGSAAPMGSSGSRDIMSQDTDSRYKQTYGKYVLDGYISSGQVDIAVNGVTVGTFSNYINRDISSYCRNGINIISFAHHPTGSGPYCPAHITLYDTARSSDPLEWTYDSAASAGESASAPPSSDSTDASSAIPQPKIPQAGSDPLAAPSAQSMGAVDERTFEDDPASYQPPS